MPEIALPTHIEIEPTETCNLRCRMCHVSYMPVENRPQISAELIDRLSVLRGTHVIIGSGFEPMMNKDFAQIIRTLTQFGCGIELVTNGTLLTEENVAALLDSDLRSMNFSFDGIRESTYEWIRRGSSFSATVQAILDFRQAFQGRMTVFAVNSTMMRSNMAELPDIVDFWDRHDFDMLRLISMVVREPESELIRQSLYPVRAEYYALLDQVAEDTITRTRRMALRAPYYLDSPLRDKYPQHIRGDHVISAHPGTRIPRLVRQEEQLGSGPGMTFPCRSPFTFARILFNGDVQLCSSVSVGNLKSQSFEEIWFGEKAREVRRRVAETEEMCKACDYYRFCLKSQEIDPEKPENYFAERLIDLAMNVDFDTGEIKASARTRPPRLVDSVNGCAIVEHRKQYFVLPHALGPVDLTQVDASQIQGVAITDSLREARRAAAAKL